MHNYLQDTHLYFSNLKYNISETNELSDLFYPSHVVTGTNATAHTFYQNAPGSKIIHICKPCSFRD